MRTAEKFYLDVLRHRLTQKEIFELFCLIDEGAYNELMYAMQDDCREWFPEEFIDPEDFG